MRRLPKKKILAILPEISYMTTREVANAIGVFTELWEIRETLEELTREGKVEKAYRPLTAEEIKQKKLILKFVSQRLIWRKLI